MRNYTFIYEGDPEYLIVYITIIEMYIMFCTICLARSYLEDMDYLIVTIIKMHLSFSQIWA